MFCLISPISIENQFITALLAAKDSYQISVPRLPIGSIHLQLPTAILLDRVDQVNLRKGTRSIGGQNTKVRNCHKWLLWKLRLSAAGQKRLISLPHLHCEVQGQRSFPLVFRPRLKTSHNLCYSLLLNQRPSFHSCLHSPAWSHRIEGGWPCKLGLTQTGRSQSVQSVCFWFCTVEWP